MGTAYRELFKLYDLIQNGDARFVAKFLSETPTEINTIIPCKSIGVLHLAVGIEPECKSRECTELLLKHGADPNLCNDDGVTPVHIAAIWGRVDNMKLLLGCGGDVTLRDFDGFTARDYATRDQQWLVCDYLDVVDDLNDTDSECAFTLELDKILVTTDEVVAEYEFIDEVKTNTTCRKSEIVRTWCDNNSLVVNKLYPTILGETYLLDNESVPWDRNITLDLTTDTFKTCLSKKNEVEISGIQRLEATHATQANCTCNKSIRKGVYENFSLPGSPKLITHKNYNTKCSLRTKFDKNTINESLISSDRSFDGSKLMDEFSKMRIHDDVNRNGKFNDEVNKPRVYDDEIKNRSNESLISSDRSLDKAMAVVQNRTNEWLSDKNMHDKGLNTRRSSASSGVSSHYSGSVAIAQLHEEYRYRDRDEHVLLIEKRLLVSPVILPVDEACDGSPDQTVLSIASSLPTSVKYDDKTLRTELLKLGFNPGPIQDTTRTLYLKKLQALKKNTPVVNRQEKAYSLELKKSLRSEEWMTDLNTYIELDRKVRANFTDPSKKWREGKSKTSFTYLLLDPRMTDNLPAKQGQTKMEAWTTFVNSIFYVGKGKRSRPYAHLYQALTLWKGGFKKSNDKKIQYILDIWQDKVGVVCLHIFQNVIPAEAYTYEAAMIDVMGLSTLKNLKGGTYYGVAASWPLKERRMLGLYLLYKAMQIFVNEGERQLRPDDI